MLNNKSLPVSNIMWSLMAKLFAMVFYFCADVFYARTLGVVLYAEWVFFFSIAHMAFYIGWFGINTSVKVHISKNNCRDNCVGAAIKVRLFFSIIITTAIFLIVPLFVDKIGYPYPYAELKNLLYIMSGMLFFNSLTDFYKQLYVGTQEFKMLCAVTAFEYFLYCFFSVAFLKIYNNPVSIAIGYCIAGMVITVGSFLLLIKKYNYKLVKKGTKDKELQKKIVEYALPLVVTSIGGLILMEMDTFMLGLLGTEQQVAAYSIAKQLVSKATNVNMAIWTGTVASLVMITKERYEEKKKEFKNVNKLNNVVAICISLCFIIFGDVAIKVIYGKAYLEASKILIMLVPYYILYCCSSFYAGFLDFMGRARRRAVWYTSVIVINLSLNYILIPIYGGAGAAVATIISLIPYTIYCIYDIRNIFINKYSFL